MKLAAALALGFAVALQSASPASAADITIGQIVPLTGSNAANGVPLSQGAKLYFDYLNSHGGIGGNRVNLIVRDDAYKADETVRQARELIDKEHVTLLMGVLGTANNEALIKEKALGPVPLVGPRTGATSLYSVPGIYTIRASYHDEARKIVQQLTTIGLTRIGVVYQDDGFGTDVVTGLEKALADRKLQLDGKISFERNTVKVEAAVDGMLKADPQAIVMVGVTNPSAAFVKQFREKGGTSQIICLSAVDATVVVKTVGQQLARGLSVSTVMPNPNKATTPVIREMLQIKEELGLKDFVINFNSVEGYVTAKVVAEALRHAGATPTRESVRHALDGIHDYDVGGYRVNLDSRDTSQRYVDLAVVGAGGVLMQ